MREERDKTEASSWVYVDKRQAEGAEARGSACSRVQGAGRREKAGSGTVRVLWLLGSRITYFHRRKPKCVATSARW